MFPVILLFLASTAGEEMFCPWNTTQNKVVLNFPTLSWFAEVFKNLFTLAVIFEEDAYPSFPARLSSFPSGAVLLQGQPPYCPSSSRRTGQQDPG